MWHLHNALISIRFWDWLYDDSSDVGSFATSNGVHSSCNGTRIWFLCRSSSSFGFSVSLSINDNCLQPLLFYMPWKSCAFRAKYTWCQFIFSRSTWSAWFKRSNIAYSQWCYVCASKGILISYFMLYSFSLHVSMHCMLACTQKRDERWQRVSAWHPFLDVIQVRKGVLPRLLEEILSTRIMVKQAMKKLSPSQKVLHRVWNKNLYNSVYS